MVSVAGSAKPAAGHNRIPAASDQNPKNARTRVRKELSDILYPGALTSRLKRYAAEPAPDGANLTTIRERTAHGTEKLNPNIVLTGKPPLARGLHISALLLAGMGGLFLCVWPCRSRNFHTAVLTTVTVRSSRNRSTISSSVVSGASASAPRMK